MNVKQHRAKAGVQCIKKGAKTQKRGHSYLGELGSGDFGDFCGD